MTMVKTECQREMEPYVTRGRDEVMKLKLICTSSGFGSYMTEITGR
jgi:hypothetical protein